MSNLASREYSIYIMVASITWWSMEFFEKAAFDGSPGRCQGDGS